MPVIADQPVINNNLPGYIVTGFNKFYKLPTKDRHHICYMHPSIICDVFLIGIEKLKPQAKKLELDA